MDTPTDDLELMSAGRIIVLPKNTDVVRLDLRMESEAMSSTGRTDPPVPIPGDGGNQNNAVRAFSSTGRTDPPVPIPGDGGNQNNAVRAFSSTGRTDPPVPIPGDGGNQNNAIFSTSTSTKKTKSSASSPLATNVFSGNVQEIVQLLGSKDLHNLAFIITVAANTGGTLAFVVEVFSAQGDLLFKTHVSDPITPVKGEPLILSLNAEGLKEAATLALPGNYLSLSTETAAERHLISAVKLARIKQ